MSQTMLPPATSPDPRIPPPGAVAVVDSVPPGARPASPPSPEPDPPRRPSAFWRAVKWPLRQLIKALYLTGSAARRHRAAALVIVALLLVLGGGTYAVYHFTHPAAQPGQRQDSNTIGTISNGQDTPFTIVNSSVPLATGAINFLNGCKTSNVQELLASTEPRVQAGGTIFNGQQGTLTASDWPGLIQYFKSHGVLFQQFVYAGGFLHVDGTASYTIQVIVGFKDQPGASEWTWYLTVGTDGKIAGWQDLTPAPQTSPTP